MKFSKSPNGYYVGLMSGTSMDGIDAVLTKINASHCETIATLNYPLENTIKQQLLQLATPGHDELNRLAILDNQLGYLFAEAVNALLKKANIDASQIIAIGSHGQTIRHEPNINYPYTMQIGNPNIIAYQTGITTIADFRKKDMAAGGQGAPLLPAFHAHIIPDISDKVILNIGGIANITYFQNDIVYGFDTGPGNMLLDAWIHQHLQKSYDHNGEWALAGNLSNALLDLLMAETYFVKKPPKSTGRELFNLEWLQQQLNAVSDLSPNDIQHTLLHLTAKSIANDIQKYCHHVKEIIVCGGGSHNQALLNLIHEYTNIEVTTTDKYNIPVDFVEACAFAWFAYQTMNHKPSNLPSVTGAKKTVILGGIYLAD